MIPVLGILTNSVNDTSITETPYKNLKHNNDFIKIVWYYKLNMINQNKNLEIALKESENNKKIPLI